MKEAEPGAPVNENQSTFSMVFRNQLY